MFSAYTLHHVGIILPSIEEAETFMTSMGLVEDYRGFVETWSCWCIFTNSSSGATIELVVAEAGPLTRFNKGFGGVHHFAFEIDDFEAVERWCAERDLKLIEPKPVKGAGDFWCNFIHPISTRGIQIEFVQPWK
jgi:catechol 2,3-dioxygenase-like lactoylglutathione lyase family enzyme